MKTHSNDIPQIQRLQGVILFPYGAIQDEKGYTYDTIKIDDDGWDINAVEWVRSTHKAAINNVCKTNILDKFSVIHQIDVSNGLYPDSGMKAWISDMIAESNRCHDLCDDAVSISSIMAIIPAWPAYVGV